MGLTVDQILAPQRIIGVVQRLQRGRSSLSKLFGFLGEEGNPAGGNVVQVSGRNFSYDVFDGTREIATGTAPGAPSNRVEPQKVGHVQGTFPRAAETISLLYEEMMNQRQLGEPSPELDTMGINYITRQEDYLAQRFLNFTEFQVASMLRGVYYMVAGADNYYTHTWTSSGADITVDFQVPSGNKDQLDMLGDGDIIDAPWDEVTNGEYTADIPNQFFGINAGIEAVCGLPLEHVVMNSVTWNLLAKNKEIKSQAGIANQFMESLQRPEGYRFTGIVKSVPWVTFHIMDHYLNVGGTRTKVIPDYQFFGFPTPAMSWVALGQGSEVVVEGRGSNPPKAERKGFYAYAIDTDEPAGHDLKALTNQIPHLYVPAAVVNGTVDF